MKDRKDVPPGPDRRRFLQGILSAAAVGVAAQSGIDLAFPSPIYAQSNLTPDEALKELLDGNERFVNGLMKSFGQDETIIHDHSIEKQEPFAAVLSCADSRVPVEIVFDQTIGHIFVVRVAGNLVTPELIASLEYGVAVLGVKALLVLGHKDCGAVKEAMKAGAAPGQISALYQYLQPAVEQSGGNVEKAIRINAKLQAGLLHASSPVIREAVKARKLRVDAGFYDLTTGKVSLV